MIHILMNGCYGKMGQVITKLCADNDQFEIIAGTSRQPDKMAHDFPVYKDLADIDSKSNIQPDVMFDFSSPVLLPEVLDFCRHHSLPLVVGTTGLTPDDQMLMKESAKDFPIFFSANMSLGVRVVTDLAKIAAGLFEDSYDIEIVERHHHEKKDAPSGTALAIANEINATLNDKMKFVYDRTNASEKRQINEIGISSIRGGTIPGEHTIIFAGHDEIIEIKHTALSRDIFGKGAFLAAEYIVKKRNGFYTMQTMIKEHTND